MFFLKKYDFQSGLNKTFFFLKFINIKKLEHYNENILNYC